MWRCLNYIFGYCSGEPEQVSKTETETYRDMCGLLQSTEVTRLSCAQDPETCGKFKTWEQVLDTQQNTVQGYRPEQKGT